MEQTKKAVLPFYMVGNGKFAEEAQRVFEECQDLALQSEQKMAMEMKIEVVPPPKDDPFGQISFSIKRTNPVMKSPAYHTEFSAGRMVKDADSIMNLLQTSFLNDTNLSVKGN